ncbi:hypothetical protein E6W39_18865 [Kitasatospora acidiphila]|uniref:Uncharacterized protein n=1 Tax=Kitasatospora acidiphila TaxID=2567942 RepID=A0A540W4H7_9ACTN|nr:hypothetical protein [Kitasatospora acidiphila]TQF03916.1 hypothetical protein E6W39_18865 [Kitasatospora acidiphila]
MNLLSLRSEIFKALTNSNNDEIKSVERVDPATTTSGFRLKVTTVDPMGEDRVWFIDFTEES